jgi:hypothetical protein
MSIICSMLWYMRTEQPQLLQTVIYLPPFQKLFHLEVYTNLYVFILNLLTDTSINKL